jgi:hypothetical protein
MSNDTTRWTLLKSWFDIVIHTGSKESACLSVFSSYSSSGLRAYAPDASQPIGLLCDACPPPVIFRRSHFRRQVPPRPYDARDPSSERWRCGWECWLVILPKFDFHVSFRDLLHAANLWHGTEGRCAEDFFALKNGDGFGRVWTCELGYLKAACYP